MMKVLQIKPSFSVPSPRVRCRDPVVEEEEVAGAVLRLGLHKSSRLELHCYIWF